MSTFRHCALEQQQQHLEAMTSHEVPTVSPYGVDTLFLTYRLALSRCQKSSDAALVYLFFSKIKEKKLQHELDVAHHQVREIAGAYQEATQLLQQRVSMCCVLRDSALFGASLRQVQQKQAIYSPLPNPPFLSGPRPGGQ